MQGNRDGSDSSDSDEPSDDHPSHMQLLSNKNSNSDIRKPELGELVKYSKASDLNISKSQTSRQLSLEDSRNYFEYLTKEFEDNTLLPRKTLALNNRQIGKNRILLCNRSTEQAPGLHVIGRGQDQSQKNTLKSNGLINNILWRNIKVTSPGKLIMNRSNMPLSKASSKLLSQNGDERHTPLRLFGSSLIKEVSENLSLRSRSFLTPTNKKYLDLNQALMNPSFRKPTLPLNFDVTISPITSKKILYNKTDDNLSSYNMRHLGFLK
ncbi:Hypothetical predicted protein [Octopus vulgaris]|uniref:Uncharacterized protein n=1 Tax=Octopus vulgaris TaxID=6645 RepID=A0AA36BFZ1_OCTVU|nr:Hypothetical predicted protein [Octopus vulgaris]